MQINDLVFRGHDIGALAKDLVEYFRRALLFEIDRKANQILSIPEEQASEQIEQVDSIPLELLLSIANRMERVLVSLRNSLNPRLLLESELVRICRREISVGMEGLERRIGRLEDSLKSQIGISRQVKAVPKIASEQPFELAAMRPKNEEPRGSRERFKIFLKAISQKSQIISSFFRNAELESFQEGNYLKLVLESEFSARNAKEPRHLPIIRSTLEEVFGKFEKLEIIARNQASEKSSKPPIPEKVVLQQSLNKLDQEERRKILEKPSVSDAIEVFGGEIVQIEKD